VAIVSDFDIRISDLIRHLRFNQHILNIPRIMIEFSRLRPLLLSALFAFALVAEPLLPGSLQASKEKKIEFPAASQHSVVKQRVGLTDVEVDYSRPNKNDREIFGGLVPYGKLWRTGANAVTKIKFSKPVTLGGKEIPAGEYALFTIPTADEWTIIVSKDAKVQSAADYKQENDAARLMVKPEPIPVTIETFTIELADVKGASATLNFLWDKTRVPVKLTTSDVEQVSKQLDAVVSSATPLDPRTAYQAAAFYYDNNKDMNQAARWIDQALEKNPNAYFMHYKKAQIQARLGDKKEAIASAQKAIDILKKDQAPDESAIRNAQQIIDSSK
jgi:tetratricopeptide (TPR) repeat protein